MEIDSVSRNGGFHLEGDTKHNKFPKKWYFQRETGDVYKSKKRHIVTFLIFGTKLGTRHEGFGHNI